MKGTWQTSGNTSTSAPVVYVGLSGGVDSAVSAALLKSQGYTVVGVFIRIVLEGYPCTAAEDRLSAMRVAAHLRIPFKAVDLSVAYKERVFAHAVTSFEKGTTPNPDALCNREIKFGLFFDWCMREGAAYVATGHYAQTKNGLLYKGIDPSKDQSYFLWAVPQQVLQRTLFPIGHLYKERVRVLAQRFGLPNAARKDSQGLCFLGPISIGEMLERELPLEPGVVLNEAGESVGEHRGAAGYTLGQRHGFTLYTQSEASLPHYVVGKNIVHNTITVSTEKFPQGFNRTRVTLTEQNWIGPQEWQGTASYRYHQPPMEAVRNGSEVLLSEPHYIPLGQSLVMYTGERCLGGGVVEKSELL